MPENFWQRLFRRTPDPAPEPAEETLNMEEQAYRRYMRTPLAELQIDFYGKSQATVECLDYQAKSSEYQIWIALDYYADVLFQMGNSDSTAQLYQFVGALGRHLLVDGQLKRISILGSSIELVMEPPEAVPLLYEQTVTLIQNEDDVWELEFAKSKFPTDFFAPLSVLLVFQHMLYTLDEPSMARLLMGINAMHTYYSTFHNYAESEGRSMAVKHAMHQTDEYLNPTS